jgi:MFS family permease
MLVLGIPAGRATKLRSTLLLFASSVKVKLSPTASLQERPWTIKMSNRMKVSRILTRDFILVFSAQFTLSSAFNSLLPTIPIYLAQQGATEREIGIMVGAVNVASLVLRPLVGRGLVRTPEKTFMEIGAILFVLTSMAYLFAPPFWPLLIVRILQGVGVAFFYTSSVTFVTTITPQDHRAQSLGYFYLAFNFAFALAPSFGIFVMNSFNFTILFLFCGALSLGALLLTFQLPGRQADHPQETSFRLSSFVSIPSLPSAAVSFLAHFIWGALTTFIPLYAIQQGIENPGFFFGAYAATLILGRVLGGRAFELYNREKIILPCLSFNILAMMILLFSKTLPMILLVAFVWGAGNSFLFPSLAAYTLERVTASPGLAMATLNAVGDLGVGLGSIIMGFVLQASSYRTMFLCLAFTAVINVFYFRFLVRKTKARVES